MTHSDQLWLETQWYWVRITVDLDVCNRDYVPNFSNGVCSSATMLHDGWLWSYLVIGLSIWNSNPESLFYWVRISNEIGFCDPGCAHNTHQAVLRPCMNVQFCVILPVGIYRKIRTNFDVTK